MKYIIRLAKRIKVRFYVAAIIVIASIAVTPWAVDEAYRFRGYEAIGGEYMIIPLGIVIAMFVLSLAGDLDKNERRKEQMKNVTVPEMQSNINESTMG